MANPAELAEFADLAGRTAGSGGDLVNSLPGLGAAYRGFCRVWAGTPGGRILQGANIDNICSPVWNNDGRGAPTEGPPPFSGGQCPGQQYIVRTRNVEFGGEQDNQRPGPIGGLEERGTPGQTQFRPWFIVDNDGNTVGQAVGTSGSSSQNLTYEIVSVSPLPGESDDCGDLPGQFQPGSGYQGEQFDQPQNLTGPDGSPNTVTIGTPFVDEAGNLVIPVNVNGDEFNLGTGIPGDTGPGPTEAGDPLPGDENSGEVDVPDLGPGTRCVAIAVSINNVPAGDGTVTGTFPNLKYYSPQGGISVKCETDDGQALWTPDQVIMERFSSRAIPVEGLRITSFRVNVKPGLGYVATPIYRVDADPQA